MQDHKQEVFNNMKMMGFDDGQIESAWNSTDIKTVEGLINFIEIHPPQNKDEQKEIIQEKQNKNVKDIVKAEILESLIQQYNYSRLIAEKATLLSGNKSLEDSLKWIEEHKDDKDFSDPIEVEKRPDLTDEEARKEAIKLQKEIREKALEIEKEKQLEDERRRLQQGKELTEARRKQKSVEKKLALEAQLREKRKLEAEKAEMERILEEDKKRRFGENYKPMSKESKGFLEESQELYEKMYKVYRMGQIKELKTCIQTLFLYTKNIVENPTNEKFMKINGNNSNFQNRVGNIVGGNEFLKLIGFRLDNDGFYHLENGSLEERKQLCELFREKLEKLDQLA